MEGQYPTAKDALRAATFMTRVDRKFRGWDYYGSAFGFHLPNGAQLMSRITALGKFGNWLVAARYVERQESFTVEDSFIDTATAMAVMAELGPACPELPLTAFTQGGYFAWPEGVELAGVVVRRRGEVAARIIPGEDIGPLSAYARQAAGLAMRIHEAVLQRDPSMVDGLGPLPPPAWLHKPGLDPLTLPPELDPTRAPDGSTRDVRFQTSGKA